MVCATPMSKCHPVQTGLHQQFFCTASYFSPRSRGIHWHWRRHENPCHQHCPWLLLYLAPDPQRTSLSAASRLGDSRSSLGGQRGWLLQCCSCRDSRLPAKTVTVSNECGGSADLLGKEVRPHNATTPGTALVVSRNVSGSGYACWPTAVWLAQRHSTWLTLQACLPTLPLVVVCVLLTVGCCNCRQLGVPHSATERSLSQRRAPGTVCRPRFEIRTHCWHSDEWLKLICFNCRSRCFCYLVKCPSSMYLAMCHLNQYFFNNNNNNKSSTQFQYFIKLKFL